jgi:hypothetical protein
MSSKTAEIAGREQNRITAVRSPQAMRSAPFSAHGLHGAVQRLQRSRGNQYVQRLISRMADNASGNEVPPTIESAIDQARGGGRPLDSGTQLQLESAFGADFSRVRVHTGSEAHTMNREVQAVAFTTGRDIFFSNGAYNPGTSAGRELLAHELTHVVQQNGAPTLATYADREPLQRACTACSEGMDERFQPKLEVSQPNDAAEREADEVARSVTTLLDQTAGS